MNDIITFALLVVVVVLAFANMSRVKSFTFGVTGLSVTFYKTNSVKKRK